MSEPANLVPGCFRVFQGTDGSFVDIHETHGKLESPSKPTHCPVFGRPE